MVAPYKTETNAGLPVLIVPDAREAGMLEGSLKNYIAETWRKTMQRDDIYKNHPSLRREAVWSRIERLLNSPLTQVTLALWPETAAEGELFVVGWLVTGPGVVHFAYVRERYRSAGVMTALFNAEGIHGFRGPNVPCTHWSDTLPNDGRKVMFQAEEGSATQQRYLTYAGVDWVPQSAPTVEQVQRG